MSRTTRSKVSSAPVLSGFAFDDISLFLAGQLPEQLGQLVNLTHFNVAGNMLEGGLSIRTELHQTMRL